MITDWVDFMDLVTHATKKTPIWKSIGRSTNRTKLLPRRRKKEEKKIKKIGGNEIPRESRGLTLKEERIEGKGKGQKKREKRDIIIERGVDQRSFKLRSCGAKILTGNNRFQNGLAHGGVHIIDRLRAFLSLSSSPLLILTFPLLPLNISLPSPSRHYSIFPCYPPCVSPPPP